PTSQQGDLSNTQPLLIGLHPAYPRLDLNFRGGIDELSMYRRALSQGEIQGIYNAGGGGKSPGTNAGGCAPPAAGLVSWWRGESNALDSVGSNNGVLQGGAAFAAGEVGQAFNFNGTSAYVQVPDAPNLRFTTAMTFEAWIYPRVWGGR